jgi:hypothetical protein
MRSALLLFITAAHACVAGPLVLGGRGGTDLTNSTTAMLCTIARLWASALPDSEMCLLTQTGGNFQSCCALHPAPDRSRRASGPV